MSLFVDFRCFSILRRNMKIVVEIDLPCIRRLTPVSSERYERSTMFPQHNRCEKRVRILMCQCCPLTFHRPRSLSGVTRRTQCSAAPSVLCHGILLRPHKRFVSFLLGKYGVTLSANKKKSCIICSP